MAKYNGHRNWNAWNVALWINNDEGLYNLACEAVRQCRTKDGAARGILGDLRFSGITRTPDGAKYNFTCIREAIREI